MKYEDPILVDNVNVSREPPVCTFLKLSIALVLILTITYFILSLTIYHLVKFIPREYEKKISDSFISMVLTKLDANNSESNKGNYVEKTKALQKIANKLVKSSNFDGEDNPFKDSQITVHYSSNESVNAFATLGGNIIINKGLISVMENENSLAMVIGHEIGHVAYRDAISSLGRIALTNIFISMFLEMDNLGITNTSISLLELNHSRDIEQLADEYALKLLNNTYQNSYGATRLFEIFSVIKPSKSKWIELTESHSLPVNRRSHILKIISENSYSQSKDAVLPLSAVLQTKNEE